MTTYSDHEQRQLDIASGRERDHRRGRYYLYEIGEQPCQNFRPKPDDDHEHQCPKCDGWRRFCNICCLDHHSSGWDTCHCNENTR